MIIYAETKLSLFFHPWDFFRREERLHAFPIIGENMMLENGR
jgi:hypothetical protein